MWGKSIPLERLKYDFHGSFCIKEEMRPTHIRCWGVWGVCVYVCVCEREREREPVHELLWSSCIKSTPRPALNSTFHGLMVCLYEHVISSFWLKLLELSFS